MKTAKDLANWILDYPLLEQATLDEGTKSEMEIIYRCRTILNASDKLRIGEVFMRALGRYYSQFDTELIKHYRDMVIELKDNSLLDSDELVDVEDLPPIVKSILNKMEQEQKNKS